MRKFGAVVVRELGEAIPPTIYFAAVFHAVAITKAAFSGGLWALTQRLGAGAGRGTAGGEGDPGHRRAALHQRAVGRALAVRRVVEGRDLLGLHAALPRGRGADSSGREISIVGGGGPAF